MTYSGIGMQRFGGLRLDVDPMEAGPEVCVDGMNFELDDDGRLRPRAGWRQWVNMRGAPTSATAIYQPAGSWGYVIVGPAGRNTITYNESVAVAAWAFGGDWASFAEVLLGGVRHVLIAAAPGVLAYNPANGALGDFSSQAVVDGAAGRAMPIGYAAGATPWGADRYVTAHATPPGGGGYDQDIVWFSEPGEPTRWTSSNYVRIEPGRGGGITAMAAWREYLFVFKRDRFAVFYGESQLADGSPVFQYRMVNKGVGAANNRAVAVAPEGVYFGAADGAICLTTGADVRMISGPVRPVLESIEPGAALTGDEAAPPWWTGWAARVNYFRQEVELAYAQGRLYVRMVGRFPGVGDRFVMLVYDAVRDLWMPWLTPVERICAMPGPYSGGGRLLGVLSDNGTRYVGELHAKSTNRTRELDGSNVAAPHWRSGMYELASNAQANLRQTALWGRTPTAGTSVRLAVGCDDTGLDDGGELELPARTIPGRVMQVRSRRARYFCHHIRGAAAGGRWVVHGLEHEIDSVRPVGVGR